jgi:hypothetical protein
MKKAWPLAYGAILLGMLAWLNVMVADDQQYSRLAASFLSGNLFLDATGPNKWADTAPFGDHHYLALGPFPAVLSMPLVWTGYFSQSLLSFIMTLGIFLLCARLARRFNYSIEEATWFALAFCFGTSFIGVAALPSSNFFAHVVAVLCLFLAINEYEGKHRPWLIGGFIGFAMASRAPAGLNLLYFLLDRFFSTVPLREKINGAIKLLLPFVTVLGLLALYNVARFGDPLESGYSYQLNGFGVPYAVWEVPGNTAGPALSLSNIPGHLWIFLFGLPSTAAIGTSVLLISPFLLYLLSVHWDLTNRLIAFDVAVVLFAVLAFRSTGFEQVGYRFSLDFLPFVFWLLMRSRVTMSKHLKILIFLATVLDICLTLFFLASGVDRRQK